MRREDLVDLNAFLTVAEEKSFTRAAATLGTSQSSLSHTIVRLSWETAPYIENFTQPLSSEILRAAFLSLG